MLVIDPKDVNPLDLPSLLLESRHELPDTSALYFVLDEDDEILYIGRTISLVKRWRGHHLFAEFEQLGNVRIAWMECDARLITSSETKFIAHFKPLLNQVNLGRRYRELTQNKILCFLTPQKLNLYRGTFGHSVNPINGKFNWQYGDKYRACAIQDLKELASDFQLIKWGYDSETVSCWADKWLELIHEALSDKRGFEQTIKDCNEALMFSRVKPYRD